MKQFNLTEYLNNPSRKVVTRDGNPVRIICTDHDNISYPIIGTIKGYDFPFCFDEDGYVAGSKCDDANDLFFDTQKHKGWVNIFKGTIQDYYIGDTRVFESKEEAEKAGEEWSGYIAVKIEWEE